ncbi:hypothetical protein FNV43_RR08445 [Rhamnella rubrinervis]|uniref:Uncharacterized protein n=1 Tax=Rhamnella rubrinervis TaxID=2594499 RepID=A0A8K0MJ34_9ROSA|nr:hypothetical protein FNV43_RR08445 [Rhamnella rubrinervis]
MVTKCIEEIYDALAEHLLPTAAVTSNPNLKHIVGLAGPPVAVKPPDVVVVFPMDGFHLYCSQLDAMEGSVYVPSFDHGAGDPESLQMLLDDDEGFKRNWKKLGKKDWDFGKIHVVEKETGQENMGQKGLRPQSCVTIPLAT